MVKRCGVHRDFGTFTLIFQDHTGGLQHKPRLSEGYQDNPGDSGGWEDVIPNGGEVVMMWGWCMAVLSNDRVHAPLHRVVAPPALREREKESTLLLPRRTAAIFFVAPDGKELLYPRVLHPDTTLGTRYNHNVMSHKVTVEEFKAIKYGRPGVGRSVGNHGLPRGPLDIEDAVYHFLCS